MGEEERWERVRQIVREECERIEERILEVLEKHTKKTKLGFASGKWIGITEEQIAAWKEAYGLCDVEAELKKSAAWLLSNPSKAPKSNFARFVNAWLARQQTTLSIRSIPTRNERVEKMNCEYCGKGRTGVVNGIAHCGLHTRDAMDGVPVRAA